jgi:DNA-3-methyladenine glycosylase II
VLFIHARNEPIDTPASTDFLLNPLNYGKDVNQVVIIAVAMPKYSISTPPEFSFEQCLSFLKRSPQEVLHRVSFDGVTKYLHLGEEKVLVHVSDDGGKLLLHFRNGTPSPQAIKNAKEFVTDWFDLKTDLKPFYALAANDLLLGDLIKTYYGYRIVGQPDLFESLIWAVIGQQINLTFAYTLKRRFVESFGESIGMENDRYYLFPPPLLVSQLSDRDLLPLQFSRQKSLYVVEIAKAFASGMLSKEKMKDLSLLEARDQLMKIKGVGNWTANYALMKTFRYPDAFPLEDVGIHNAIKNLKRMKTKPSLEQVKRIFKKYKGWEAYATLYLWKSL